jgi:GxGYxYP putative glycoside hydrolase C-terminal domain
MSTLSSVRENSPLRQQPAYSRRSDGEKNVHYVCFYMSDGDNVGYTSWTMQQKFGSTAAATGRGQFPLGWGISPSLVDVAPSMLRWYYQNATPDDRFITGPSGPAYTYPTHWPVQNLNTYIKRTNEFLGASDIHILQIMDDNGNISRMDLWDKFLAEPNINAIFFTAYSASMPLPGSILFSPNGKPVIQQRDILWADYEEAPALAANINSRSTDPSLDDSYSLVMVHVWDYGVSDIQAAIDLFNPNVKVVTPEEFVRLIKKNLTPKHD